MRYPASEKPGVSRPAFYRWYDLYQRFGEMGLEDKRARVIDLALDQPELSPPSTSDVGKPF